MWKPALRNRATGERNRTTGLIILVVAAAVFLGGITQISPPARQVASLEAEMDAYLKPFVDGGHFSGVVLIARKGKPVVHRAYGMANYELGVANTPQTGFHIASVSKVFTAAAILLLESQGRLSTSDAVSRWGPELPQGNRITLHHLLTHTSGIANINDAPFYTAESKKPHTTLDLVRLIQGMAPRSAPGERYEYSNSNYNILAYIIERASGQSYGAFLDRAIFEPLSMKHTGHDGGAQSFVPNLALGCIPVGLKGFGKAPSLDWSVKTGNGSIYSTTADLLKFDQALYQERLLSKRAIEKILNAGRGNVYGWFVGERFGRRHMSANGRSPGFTASFDRYFDDQVTVIVLANSYSTVTQAPIASDLAALALGQPSSPPMRIEPISLSAAALSPYEGTYLGGDDFFFPSTRLTLTRHDGYLMMHWSTGANSIVVPVSEREFLDRSFWARVRFVRDNSGKVARLVWNYDGRDYPAVRLR